MTRASLVTVAAVFATAAAPPTAQAAEIRISTWGPPSLQQNSDVFPQWTACLKEASKGAVTTKTEYNLGPPPVQFQVARKGVSDVAWSFHGYNAGRFVSTRIAELPGTRGGAEAISVAHWRTHVKYLDGLKEFRGLKLIGLFVHGAAVLMTNKQVTDLSQVKGMKLRLPGGVATQVFGRLGAVPVKVPGTKVYEVLSQRVADGVSMEFSGVKSFKLNEVVKYVLEMPGGFYYGSFGIVMSPKKYASLAAAEKAAVDKCSGETLSRIAGRVWENFFNTGKTFAAKDMTIAVASEKVQQEFAPIAKAVIDAWIKEARSRGIKDPRAALDYFREQARTYKK